MFVNPTLQELDDLLADVPLAVIQLHGQETPEYCQQVKARYSLPVWKALAVGGEEDAAAEIARYAGSVDAYLFDTYDPSQAGGTGKRFSWEQIPQLQEACQEKRIIAGGINTENVSELINRYQAEMIDVSSGVETDGEKDAEKIKTLVERVKGA